MVHKLTEIWPIIEAPQNPPRVVHVLQAKALCLNEQRLRSIGDIAQHDIGVDYRCSYALGSSGCVKLLRWGQRYVALGEIVLVRLVKDRSWRYA